MPQARPLARIALNAALDCLAGALAVLAAGPVAAPLHLPPLPAVPLGAAAVLAAGLPFGLSRQHWRFAGFGDVAAVCAAAGLGAVGLAAVSAGLHLTLSPNPAYPVVFGLLAAAFLAGPRIAYRLARTRPRAPTEGADSSAALLAGALEDADLFLRALAQDRRQTMTV
ncbi:MAG: polysaccharide biosynthesis protein, partial [Acetobacteraceae bacterium]